MFQNHAFETYAMNEWMCMVGKIHGIIFLHSYWINFIMQWTPSMWPARNKDPLTFAISLSLSVSFNAETEDLSVLRPCQCLICACIANQGWTKRPGTCSTLSVEELAYFCKFTTAAAFSTAQSSQTIWDTDFILSAWKLQKCNILLCKYTSRAVSPDPQLDSHCSRGVVIS